MKIQEKLLTIILFVLIGLGCGDIDRAVIEAVAPQMTFADVMSNSFKCLQISARSFSSAEEDRTILYLTENSFLVASAVDERGFDVFLYKRSDQIFYIIAHERTNVVLVIMKWICDNQNKPTIGE